MANKRIDELTAATSIASTDLIFVGNPSTGELKKATANLLRQLVLHGGATVASFTDGQTCYFGSFLSGGYTTSEGFVRRIYFPIACTIKSVIVYGDFGTAGSNEGWSMYVRLNATTDTLIESVSVSSTTRTWTNTSLAISIASGDYIMIKSVQPTWGTNPANGIFHVVIVADY